MLEATPVYERLGHRWSCHMFTRGSPRLIRSVLGIVALLVFALSLALLVYVMAPSRATDSRTLDFSTPILVTPAP
jgi:hypothetical protein